MHKLSLLFWIGSLALAPDCVNSVYGQQIQIARSGLIYGLGRVERVDSKSAQIDLGDVHTLRPGEKVAIFRPQGNYFVPIGVLVVGETHPTFCRTTRSTSVKPEAGDIAMFTREFSQLKTAAQHRDDYVRHRVAKNTGRNRYSTFGEDDVAIALADYRDHYEQWERSQRDVVGYLPGKTFAGGKESEISQLLKQISMMRELHRVGSNTLPAAGPQWVAVMNVLFGPTVVLQHRAAQKIVTDEFADEEVTGPPIRDIERQVRDTLFDRRDEEQKLVTYLVANIIENSPRSLEIWFTHNLKESQFPQMAEEVALVDQVRRILKELRGDQQ